MLLDPCQLAQECPDAATFERALLGQLQRQIGFEAAFFKTLGDPGVTTIQVEPAHLEGAFAPGNPYERELRPVKQAALGRRGVAVDTEVLGPSRAEATAYHRDFVAPRGGRHTLLGYARLRGQVRHGLMLGRTGGPFRAHEIAHIEALLPTVAIARASFGQRWQPGPLPRVEAPRSLLSRLLLRPRTLASAHSQGVDLEIRDQRGYREMVARQGGRGMIWSRVHLERSGRSGWPCVELFHVGAALAERRQRALLIGAGGGVLSRQLACCYPGILQDVVEIDAGVIELARVFFDLHGVPGVRVHQADGAAFVAQAEPATWDVLFVDACGAGTLPPGLATRGFFADARRSLRPGGALAINVVGPLAGESPVRSVARAARTAFEEVRLLPVVDRGEAFSAQAARNVVVVAR